ncbi:glycosyltransferase [Novosphingobium sp. CCH12-A3]|uniref:glycosyltransferase n=1 Tax=Novosphingobium sp. CCH12-A3 TaxID=1768752 RepID=UPI000780D9E8|nr:glycosyltransferase [Novosphingobium sp. CCH12-A3]
MIRFAIPPIGGQEWFGGWMYMRNFVRALALYGDSEIEAYVFVGEDRADEAYISEFRSLPRTKVVVEAAFDTDFRNGTLKTLLTGRRAPLLNAFKREGITVALDWATYYGWRSEIPTIAWIPDFQHRALPHLFGKVKWYRRETGFRLQIGTSAAVLLSSAAAEHDCHAYYPASRGKTHVARFAVPVDDWSGPLDAVHMLQSAGIPRDFIFLPNQLWHHKNHFLAIEAASILAKRGSDRVIVATGRGSDPRRPNYRTELMNQIVQSGAASNFVLLEGVDHALVKAMMTTTNALLNPSLFEGWSTTVEEAKAIGTPLLLSDIPVHREQAPEAEFFNSNDALALAEAIEASPVRTTEMIAASSELARSLNVKNQMAFAHSITQVVKQVARAKRYSFR